MCTASRRVCAARRPRVVGDQRRGILSLESPEEQSCVWVRMRTRLFEGVVWVWRANSKKNCKQGPCHMMGSRYIRVKHVWTSTLNQTQSINSFNSSYLPLPYKNRPAVFHHSNGFKSWELAKKQPSFAKALN